MPRLRRLQSKFLLMSLVVSMVPLGALGIYGYSRISASLESTAIHETRQRLDRAARQMEGFLSQAVSDLDMLSQLPELGWLIETTADSDPSQVQDLKVHLQMLFSAVADSKKFYHQIRYIDETGREVVRVEYDNDAVRVVPDDELQDKSDRYYFKAAMALSPGGVFRSPLDLNREHDQIEKPPRPTLRYARPVFAKSGRPRGIVITNLHAGGLLDQACMALGQETGTCFAVDERGYYTMHTTPGKTWGSTRDLGTGEGLMRDYPTEWQGLMRCEKDQTAVHDGMLFCTPVSPPPEQPGSDHPKPKWLLGKVYQPSVVLAPLREFRPIFTALLAATLLLAVALAVFLARRVTAPIKALKAGAERLGAGDLDHAIEITSSDETGALARDFNTMAARLKEYVRDLQETTAAKERAQSELRVARGIQRTMLPHAFPAFPHVDAVDVHARYEPAREVGGDFYNFFFIDDHRLALVLGDVAGKGVPAALVMAMTQTLIRTHAGDVASPAEILRRTNQMLVAETRADVFVTAFAGIYDTRDGQLVWANAGHPSPLLMCADGNLRELDGSDLVLGVADPEDFEIDNRSARLQPGERVVVYTDGVTEAADTAGRAFGLDGLEACLRQCADGDLDALCDAVVTAVLDHQSGRPQFDDITLLALEVHRLIGQDIYPMI